MTSAFSSSDAAAIERQVDQVASEEVRLESFWNSDERDQLVQWIRTNDFTKVALQFPDVLLPFSAVVANELQSASTAGIFILGDTSYGSCCVDEVAASHVGADAVIHFGHACLSRSVRLPTRYVFLRGPLDVGSVVQGVKEVLGEHEGKRLGLFYDVAYDYCVGEVAERLKEAGRNVTVGQLAKTGEQPDLLCWKLPGGASFDDAVCIFIGHDNQSFFNTANGIRAEQWFRFDPATSQLQQANPLDSRWMRRRFYYIEKCKDATSLGIVVATLTAAGYLDVVNRIQRLAKARGIRSYIISVGKINPAKLANFAEIDCFVLVGCPENDLFTSRDFFKPLVSVFECELAFNPAWTGKFPEGYSTDFADILPEGRLHKTFDEEAAKNAPADVSLVTGKIRNATTQDQVVVGNGESCTDVQLRGRNEVAQISSGDVFQGREWQGLEQNLGRDEPARIEEGRSGVPIRYDNDPKEG
ncbi:2-(3-amino-3-carboxypropyl)histidine synthase subunit 2-like [Culex pipiens pallens]|uniref:2-(3-amino-3-carboxypropyl)histidine synthase subunit 2-like n=1 Tax=Culex pipiens pallens TaxID=42434 RepID=UPI001953D684|nr:2-(3-amino-3-carboxypropyl)histidine synthase subunit 2-like [Culex pipiens pallens]